jgi:type 1 glutamine amidotransferase
MISDKRSHRMNFISGRGATCSVLLALLGGFALCATAGDAPRKKIVLIAGEPDASHPAGTHEYGKSAQLLKQALEASPNVAGLKAETHLHGWPKNPATLDTADTIVLIASGSDRNWQDHPLLVGDHLAVIEKQMRRGCGLVLIHWTTFVPRASAGDKVLEWVGGHFDYESGTDHPQHWFSRIQNLTTTATPGALDHPLCRGLRPFQIKEEFYYRLRFRENDTRLKPILLAAIPGEEEKQVVAWGVERADGGRGFGLTGGHYFDNWWLIDFRRLVLNAIVWTAHGEVPAGGVQSYPPPR